jgi:hypothetical protein
MKKLSFLLATLSIVGVAGLSGGSAHALTGTATCAVGFTGPDSKNICTSETTYKCNLTNDNKIIFLNNNEQVAISGDATTSKNTTGGSTTTGSATNSNNVTYTGQVTNGDVCTAVVTTPATVTPAETQPVTPVAAPTATQPAAAGKGAGMGAAGAIAPAALPNTSADSPLVTTLAITGSAGALLLIARLAVLAYGRQGA